MPNIKSAKKRVDVNEKNKARNKAYKSELATGLKKYKAAIASEDVSLAKSLLPVTVSLIDESVTRGIIHKNKADRKKAEVNAKFNALSAKQPKKTAKKAEVKEEVKVEEVVEVKEEAPKAKKTTTRAKKTETAEGEKKTTRKTATKKATAKVEE